MQNVRYGLIALSLLLCSVTSAPAQVSIGIGLPNVSIGINLPLYPELVRVPGYPVYYAPRIDANYFFYDGMYWVFWDDYWYASSWYNGPWWLVEPEVVPVFILRIPVRYYRQPPVYFRSWRSNAPPRWGEHWGHEWEQHRRGWDRWKRGSAPAPAPLPVYQRQYAGDRYPRAVEQQHMLRREHYRYQPRNTVVRQHFQQQREQREQRAPEPVRRGRQDEPAVRSPRQQDIQRSAPPQQVVPAAPRPQPPSRGTEHTPGPAPVQPPHQQRGPAVEDHRQRPDIQRSAPPQQVVPAAPRPQPPSRGTEHMPGPAPVQPPHQQRGPAVEDQRQRPGAVQREMQAPRPQGQQQKSPDRGKQQEPRRGRGQGEQKDEGHGRER